MASGRSPRFPAIPVVHFYLFPESWSSFFNSASLVASLKTTDVKASSAFRDGIKLRPCSVMSSVCRPLSSDHVSDMAFSPFDDSLLVTCSADETVSPLIFISHRGSHLFLRAVLPRSSRTPVAPGRELMGLCYSTSPSSQRFVLGRRWRSWQESAERGSVFSDSAARFTQNCHKRAY